MNNNVYLKLENVKKSLANFELDNVSFSLPKGYIMGLYIPARQSTLHGVLVHTFRRYSARFPVISA